MPKLSNIFKNMISGSYADEFAENHYRILVARTATRAFVPSGGTGFVIRRVLLMDINHSQFQKKTSSERFVKQLKIYILKCDLRNVWVSTKGNMAKKY